MPLTGSDVAYKQARAGIARAGATRAGYFYYTNVATINGVDRSSVVLWDTVAIDLNLNDEPDRATFTLRNVVPTSGHTVSFGIGTSTNAIFGGQVVSHTRHQILGINTEVLVEVECIDWARLFDRELIQTAYEGMSASDIVVDIVTNYTTGFTVRNVVSSLSTIDYFPCSMEKPSQALRRLANLVNGGYYIDANRDVHFFGSAGETTALAPTPPRTLTSSLSTLKALSYERDVSQIRTRVIVGGQRTTCPLSIPANVDLPGGADTLPVEDSSPFSETGGVARVGSQRVTYTSRDYPVVAGLNAEGSHVTADAAAGATSLTLDSTAWAISTGTSWCQVGDQTIVFSSFASGPPATISGIPSTGFGSLQHSVGSGDSVRALGMLVGVAGLTLAQDAGVDVAVRAEADDAAAQAAMAAIEGGDGIHEHFVSDERLAHAGCEERAEAELVGFASPLERIRWVTYDMNATPGALQVVNMTGADTISTTLLITRVSLRFPIPHSAPRRTCEASTVRMAGWLDLVTLDDGH